MGSNGWTPRSVIALVLALCVLSAVVGSFVFDFLFPEAPSDEHVVDAWENILMALVGGLIGWLSSEWRNGK